MTDSTAVSLRMRVGTAGTLGDVQSGEFVFLTGQTSPQVYLNTGVTPNSNASAVVSIPGPQGPTGNTGPSGAIVGDTGNQGHTGFMGMQGFTGASGHEGDGGFTGMQGNTGQQGFQGSTGIQGLIGAQGVLGNTGSQGLQGFPGPPGAQGFTGAQGITGIQGLLGDTGAQGERGETGAQGAGTTGAQGITGATGSQGSTGVQGVQGYTGSQGSTIAGAQGITGDTGVQGSTGSQGAQGLLGLPGPTGFTGAQGFTGSQGFDGSTGIQGSTGHTGVQGDTGFTGSQGFTGSTGATGDTGSQGSTGSQGTQGSTGSTGDTGDQGLEGFTGAQGATGYSSEKGFTGISGDTGIGGAQGHTGAPGLFGATGPQGDTGSVEPATKNISGSNLFVVGNVDDSFIYNPNVIVDSNGTLQIQSTASPVTTNTYLQLPHTVTPITYLSASNSAISTLYLIKNEGSTFTVSASSQAIYATFSNVFTQMIIHPSGWAYLYSDKNIAYVTASNYIFSYNMNTSNFSNLGFNTDINHIALDPLGFIFISSGTSVTKYRVNTSNGSLTSLYSWTVTQGSRVYATLGYVYVYQSGTTANILRFNNFSNSSSRAFTSSIYANDTTLSYLSASPNDVFIYSTTGTGNIYAYSLLTSNTRVLDSTLDPATHTPYIDPYTNMMYTALTYDNSIRQTPLDGTASSNFVSFALDVPGSSSSNTPITYTRPLGGFASPRDVKYNPIDSNVYIVSLHSIRRITPLGVITTIGGSFPGSNNGVGILASFNTPLALCVDVPGSNLYIADTGNNSIRRMQLSTLNVTTVVTGLSNPQGIACDQSNVYISDTGNHVIKQYNIATSNVSIVAGSNRVAGFADGLIVNGSNISRLNSPRGLAMDTNNTNIYIADCSNFTVRILSVRSFRLITIAGTEGIAGNSTTNLAGPIGVTIGSNSVIYITDPLYNRLISAVTPIIALRSNFPVIVTPTGGSTFQYPRPSMSPSIASASKYYPSGLIYVTDPNDTSVFSYDTNTGISRLIHNTRFDNPGGIYNPYTGLNTPANALYTLFAFQDSNGDVYTGVRNFGFFKNGIWLQNTYSGDGDSYGMSSGLLDNAGRYIYFVTYDRVMKLDLTTSITTTFVGKPGQNPGFIEGAGSNAKFYNIGGIALDNAGSNLYISDRYNHRVRVANLLTSNVTTVVGTGAENSYDNTPATNAGIYQPGALTIGNSGLLYINENDGSTPPFTLKLRIYNPQTTRITTLGTGIPGSITISVNPEETSFYGPFAQGLTILSLRRELQTFAGGTAGYVDSNAGNARFNDLAGMSFYGNSLLVADRGNYLIRSVDSTAIVRTYAGSISINRNLDGVTPFYINVYSSKFANITSACVDSLGNIYVADAQYIRLISSIGIVTTVASNFSNAGGMTLDPSGQYIYISDTGNHKVKRLALSNYSITDIAGTGSSGYTNASSTIISTITTPIPLSIPGLQLWLDAADPNGNSNVPSNGSTISTWVDKSTNSRNAISTGTNTYVTSRLNGLPGIRFSDNAVNRHYFTSLIPANTFNDSISVFIIYEATQGQNNAYCSPVNRMASGGREPILNLIFYIRTTYGGFYPYPTADTHINPTLVNIQYNSSTEPLVMRDFINGGDVILVPVWSAGTLATGINADSFGSNILIGGDREGGFLNGLVYEVLVYNTKLSSDQRQSVEGYLAQKWGISLPVSHPYYNTTPINTRYTIAPIIAQFNNPTGLCMSANNVFLYVSDSGNNVIRQICFSNATTSLLIGNSTSNGYSEGVGGAAVFSDPRGLQLNSNESMLYVVDRGNSIIRQVVISTQTSTLAAGIRVQGGAGYEDGSFSNARFSNPTYLVVDSTRANAYVTDTGNNRIRRIVLSNYEVSTLVGSNAGTVDGTGSGATFDGPLALAFSSGYLFTGEINNPKIRRINIATQTSALFAGSNVAGYLDTPGTGNVSMNSPQTLNVYSNAMYTMLNYQGVSTIVQIPLTSYPSTTFTFTNVTSNTSPILIQNTTGRQITVAVQGGTVTNPILNSIPNISDIKTLYNTSGTTYTLL
jgi:hypothetical protein